MSQAVRDALADAETYRLYLLKMHSLPGGMDLGYFAARFEVEPSSAWCHASESARIAFDLCPALRCDCEATR